MIKTRKLKDKKTYKQENLKTEQKKIFSNMLDIVTVAETWDHIWKAIEAWLVQIVWQPETYEVKTQLEGEAPQIFYT